MMALILLIQAANNIGLKTKYNITCSLYFVVVVVIVGYINLSLIYLSYLFLLPYIYLIVAKWQKYILKIKKKLSL